MTGWVLRYDPDSWAHDLGEWWGPLARIARDSDGSASAWMPALGVEEFFDRRLLSQPAVFTPWLCLAAAAVSASSACRAAEVAGPAATPGERHGALAHAVVAFELALALQHIRWNGATIRTGETTSADLTADGLDALVKTGHEALSAQACGAVALVAGWLAISGQPLPTPTAPSLLAAAGDADLDTPAKVVARAASLAQRRWPEPSPVLWGVAHLVERLANGALDEFATPTRPDDLPAEAAANVLLVSDQGELGRFEARRQHSLLDPPGDLAVPDLARLAFMRPGPDFLSSVADALAAAGRALGADRHLARFGEVISWSLQIAGDGHPLAERTVSGRSAGLGAYVTFRSLCSPGTFVERDVAFTGQVTPEGAVGEVRQASGKIAAAGRFGIDLVVHPAGAWLDPNIAVRLEPVRRAEEALVAATRQLREVSRYLEAACHLVAPEPWLRAWLTREGRTDAEVPLLEVMCRQVQVGATDDASADDELTVAQCPAHLLATRHPGLSFAISADAGGGNTVSAKRMVAEAARRALDALRGAGSDTQPSALTLPLYLPLWEQPSSWDDLVHTCVEALAELSGPQLDVAAALASALRGEGTGGRDWRALIVADGTERLLRGPGPAELVNDGDFVALLAGAARPGQPSWQPKLPTQVVLCGRNASPAHQRATSWLCRLRRGSAAVMELEPLSDSEIDKFVAGLAQPGPALGDWNRHLAANPLLLALSVIAGQPDGDCGATDLFDRGLDVLLGDRRDQRGFLAEIAFRAAAAKGEPAGEFGVRDIAGPRAGAAVADALAENYPERALANALDRDERAAFVSAERDTHLLTASSGGWRFFHDRAFAFLVADRIARRAASPDLSDDPDLSDVFGVLGDHLGDPFWVDVIESTGRLLELRDSAVSSG